MDEDTFTIVLSFCSTKQSFFCVLEPNFGYFYYFILETVMIVYLCLLNCGLVSMRTSIVGNSSMAGIPSGFWAGFIVLDMYTSKHCI